MITSIKRKHFKIDDKVVTAIATLLGCIASSGLVNNLNELSRAGLLDDCTTMGDIYGKILNLYIEDHNEVKSMPYPQHD